MLLKHGTALRRSFQRQKQAARREALQGNARRYDGVSPLLSEPASLSRSNKLSSRSSASCGAFCLVLPRALAFRHHHKSVRAFTPPRNPGFAAFTRSFRSSVPTGMYCAYCSSACHQVCQQQAPLSQLNADATATDSSVLYRLLRHHPHVVDYTNCFLSLIHI